METTQWFKNNAPVFLSIASVVGVIMTAYFAAKATPDAERDLINAEDEKGEALATTEKVWIAAPHYIPAAVCCTATVAGILGAQILDQRRQASLISAYTALEQTFLAYRNKVIDLEGPEMDLAVRKAMALEKQQEDDDDPPWDRVQTFYLEGYDNPIFFERTMDQVFQAEYHLNRNFALKGVVTWNEFLDFLGLPLDEKYGERLGWDWYIGDAFYGYHWIDFEHRHQTQDDGLVVCIIDMPFNAHPLSEDEFETGLVDYAK